MKADEEDDMEINGFINYLKRSSEDRREPQTHKATNSTAVSGGLNIRRGFSMKKPSCAHKI